MIKEIYLFVDGSLAVFDEGGQQLTEFSEGKLDVEKKLKLEAGFYPGTRITLSRWKKGFFELTREEFHVAEVVGGEKPGEFADGEVLVLRFPI